MSVTECEHCKRDVAPSDEVLHACPSCEDHVCIDCFEDAACSWRCAPSAICQARKAGDS